MYKQIESNKIKSSLLIALFIGVLSAAGYAYGVVTHTGADGLVFALVLSVGMSLVSWFAGDKIVLATNGAKQVTREQAPLVWNTVENLSIASGLPMPKVYIVDDPSPNAFATGRDPKHASIAFTTGLLGILNNEELEGVAAHELSHIQNQDTKLMMLVAVLVGAITLLGDFFVRQNMFGRRSQDDREDTHPIMMVIGIVFLILSPLIGQLIQLAISRRREFLADASGALMTRYPDGLASALQKIAHHAKPMAQASRATAHLWIANPFGQTSKRLNQLFSTHPPVEERIQALVRMRDAK